jgi:predicted NAD/FAD-dependent oxidoreductase
LYLRHSVRRKNGKQHTYWRLVRSMRRGGKVVQETVAQLGELDGAGRANARLLAQHISGTDQQRELFEAPATDEQRIERRVVETFAWPSHTWTLAMSASCESA